MLYKVFYKDLKNILKIKDKNKKIKVYKNYLIKDKRKSLINYCSKEMAKEQLKEQLKEFENKIDKILASQPPEKLELEIIEEEDKRFKNFCGTLKNGSAETVEIKYPYTTIEYKIDGAILQNLLINTLAECKEFINAIINKTIINNNDIDNIPEGIKINCHYPYISLMYKDCPDRYNIGNNKFEDILLYLGYKIKYFKVTKTTANITIERIN